MHSGRGGEDCSDKCARENMNMKMHCDPGTELFNSALMPLATLVSLPKAVKVSSFSAVVCNPAQKTVVL